VHAIGSGGRIVALEGISGVGKSRLAGRLADALPGSVLVREAYDRIWPHPSLAVPDAPELLRIERTLLREEMRRYRESLRARRDHRWVFADTGFLGPLTYSMGLGELDRGGAVARSIRRAMVRAAEHGTLGAPDLTFRLEAPLSTLRRRATADPTHHPEIWRERHLLVGEREQRLWSGPIGSVFGPRCVPLRAGGEGELVVGRIVRILARPDLPGPLSRREGGRLLAAALRALGPRSATVKKGGRRPPNPST
jgi:thymidylate kinase